MPVVFQQPSPMAPDISVGGGRAQVAAHDFPSIVAMYDAANRNQLQASQASAQLGLQSSAATAHNAQQANLASTQMRERQQEFAAAQAPSQRDYFVAAQHQQQMAQQTAMSQWLMDQDLSQKEQMQLQEAQAGLATVMGDPTVSPEDKQEAMQLYQQHINPLKVRQQRMQQKVLQQQAQQAVQAGTLQAVMENGTQEARTKAMMQRIVTLPDADGNAHQFYVDHRGDLQAVPHDKVKATPADKEAMFTVHDYLKLHHELYQEAMSVYPPVAKGKQGEADTPSPENVAKHAEYVQARLRGLGLPGSPGEFVAQQKAGRGQMPTNSPPVGRPPDQDQPTAGEPAPKYNPKLQADLKAGEEEIAKRESEKQRATAQAASPEDRARLRTMLGSAGHTQREFFGSRTHVTPELAVLLNRVTGHEAEGERDVFGSRHYYLSKDQRAKIEELLKE